MRSALLFLFLLALQLFSAYCFFTSTPQRVLLTFQHDDVLMSTVVSPPKTDKKIAPDVSKPSPIPDIIFKESRDIQKEFDEYFDGKKFWVILYNDPFNKRQYVAQVLTEVFSWDEPTANAVMLQAHENGWAVTGEFDEEVAKDYCKKLTDRALLADAIPVEEGGTPAGQDAS